MNVLCRVTKAVLLITLFFNGLAVAKSPTFPNTHRIQPDTQNPAYWQYKQKPIVLIGGSVEDNLFQIDNLRQHLQLLKDSGGNYIRCTMSDRDPGNSRAFHQRDDGKFDLTQPGKEYWNRFANLLKWTAELDIIVQIEVWDRFDHSREPWESDPYNPANNINYSFEQSGFKPQYKNHPGKNDQPFFFTVPALENNTTVLPYQQQFVDRLLEHTFAYGHVLYCMDNETKGKSEWGAYWATYIRDKAKQSGVAVQLTEMWDAHDINRKEHRQTWEHPELYDFCDISQNNHNSGQKHWDNIIKFFDTVRKAQRVCPINTVKIYGSDTGRYGTAMDAQQRFWRNLFAGIAATRFHRPKTGIGLSQLAQQNLKSARMWIDAVNPIACKPANDLLLDRKENQAYCTADEGRVYSVYFPTNGSVILQLPAKAKQDQWTLRWLDIQSSQWSKPISVHHENQQLNLTTPNQAGSCIAVVQRSGIVNRN
tara:strand:- start:47578 stop:49014 length:1437 start_codon:yes stop_codon:yes gene_type:complete